MPKKVLDRETYAKICDDIIAETQRAKRDYSALYTLGYEPMQTQGLEKSRRSVSGSSGGLDRIKAELEREPKGDPRDFDGAEGIRRKLGDASQAIVNASKFASRATSDLGDIQSHIDRHHRAIDTTPPIERPAPICQPCQGDGKLREGTKVWVCPHCEGTGRTKRIGMSVEEAKAYMLQRVARMEARLDAGTPVEMVLGEVVG